MDDAYKRIHIDKDWTIYNNIIESVELLELEYGEIPNIFAVGPISEQIYNKFVNRRKQKVRTKKEQERQAEIDGLIIFDRAVDLITPMTMPYTYEGLIDEIYGINEQKIKISKDYTLYQKIVGDDEKAMLKQFEYNTIDYYQLNKSQPEGNGVYDFVLKDEIYNEIKHSSLPSVH